MITNVCNDLINCWHLPYPSLPTKMVNQQTCLFLYQNIYAALTILISTTKLDDYNICNDLIKCWSLPYHLLPNKMVNQQTCLFLYQIWCSFDHIDQYNITRWLPTSVTSWSTVCIYQILHCQPKWWTIKVACFFTKLYAILTILISKPYLDDYQCL